MVLPAGSAAVVVGAVSTLLLMEGCGLLACAQASSAPGDASQPPAWMKSEYTGIGYFGELSLPITVTFASAAEAAALGLIDGDGERGPPQRPVLAITVFGNDLVGTFDIDESVRRALPPARRRRPPHTAQLAVELHRHVAVGRQHVDAGWHRPAGHLPA